VLRKLRCALCIAAVCIGPLPEDVSHAIAEPVTQIGDDFMRGVTGRGRVAAVLD
jgi:hypothetical protein